MSVILWGCNLTSSITVPSAKVEPWHSFSKQIDSGMICLIERWRRENICATSNSQHVPPRRVMTRPWSPQVLHPHNSGDTYPLICQHNCGVMVPLRWANSGDFWFGFLVKFTKKNLSISVVSRSARCRYALVIKERWISRENGFGFTWENGTRR